MLRRNINLLKLFVIVAIINKTANGFVLEEGEIMADLKEYCPECFEEKREHNLLKTRRLSREKYIFLCDKCTYTKLCIGELPLTKDEVVKYGLPGEILDHMPLKREDINSILLLALHQHFTSKENPFLSYKYDVSYIEDVINLSLHNDPSEQPRLSTRSFNLTAVNYEDLRLTIAHHYENSMAPNIKKPVLEALAKIQYFTFPDDVIAHYLLRK